VTGERWKPTLRQMRIASILVVVLLATPPVFADTGFLDRSVTVAGTTYRFSVYVPPDYTPMKQWPIVVDLHGNGAQGDDGIRQTAHFLADQIRLARAKYPLIAVFPQAGRGQTWQSVNMPSVVIAELDGVLTEFRGDPHRVYLGGFSMGADGTYAIAARWPDRFAAVYAIAGFVPRPVEELAAHLRAIPIRIFHGETDESVPVEQSRQLVAVLKKVGAAVEYIEYADPPPAPAAEKAYAKEDFVIWLLA